MTRRICDLEFEEVFSPDIKQICPYGGRSTCAYCSLDINKKCQILKIAEPLGKRNVM